MFVVNIVLVSDGDQWGSGSMDGKIEIVTDAGMRSFNNW